VDLPDGEPNVPTHKLKSEVGTIGALKAVAHLQAANVNFFSATEAG